MQAAFTGQFGSEASGDDFDLLLAEGERVPVGTIGIEVMHVPGHTPADVAYRIDDALFTGDNLFTPDFGTARTDFPGASARQLYRSIGRILSLPRDTRLFHCHDYKAPGRDAFAWESTVVAQRASNPHVRDGVTEDEFVALREARDAALPVPALLIPAIQCNIRGGRLPPAAGDGVRRLSVPLAPASGAAGDALA